MKKVGDILDEPKLKEKAFIVPVSYFEGLEDRVSSKIGKTEKGGGFVRILKPAALLACSFVFVLLIGYGVLTLTGTTGSGAKDAVASQIIVNENDAEDEVLIEYLAQNISIEEIQEYIVSDDDNN